MNRARRLLVFTVAFLAVGLPSFSQPAQAVGSPMVLHYDIAADGSSSTRVDLPLGGNVNVSVDWGDGTSDTYTAPGSYTHIYPSVDKYTVRISGQLSNFGLGGQSISRGRGKLTAVSDWGDVGLTSLWGAFLGAWNLTDVPSTLPPGITDLSSVFYQAENFNDDISKWDTSNVTNMEYAFYYAKNFNGDVSNWDTGKVEKMRAMFSGARSFAGDVSKWNVSNVTDFESAFQSAPLFDSDLSKWNTSSATSMSYMFADYTYSGIDSKFSSDLSAWDTSNVTGMAGMFENAVSFNSDISGWDTSKVTTMLSMFENADSFNQDIGNWDTGNVTTMAWMFADNDAFDQDIGDWNVSKLNSASRMFRRAKLSVGNYDNLLIGWAKQAEGDPGVLANVPFSGGDSMYSCAAVEAREVLTDAPNTWNISDEGLAGVPGKPRITKVVNGDTSVEVQFTPPSCPDSPEVENYQVSIDGGRRWLTVKPAATAGPFIIDGLTNGVRYPIMIRALNDSGAGSSSNLVPGRPEGPEPVDPGTGTGTGSGGDSGTGTDSGSGTDGISNVGVTVSVATNVTSLTGVLPATGTMPLTWLALAGLALAGGWQIRRRRPIGRFR